MAPKKVIWLTEDYPQKGKYGYTSNMANEGFSSKWPKTQYGCSRMTLNMANGRIWLMEAQCIKLIISKNKHHAKVVIHRCMTSVLIPYGINIPVIHLFYRVYNCYTVVIHNLYIPFYIHYYRYPAAINLLNISFLFCSLFLLSLPGQVI